MKSSFSKTRTKVASAAREDAAQALAAYPAPLQMMGHDSEARAQHHFHDQINSSPRVMQLYGNHLQSNVAAPLGQVHQGVVQRHVSADGVVQLSRWGEWENSLQTVSPGTQSLALFGMAIVNEFLSSGIHARIGGSLAAKMLGGVREPADLDVEVSGAPGADADAKAMFLRWVGKRILTGEGGQLFFISEYSNQSGVVAVKYHGPIIGSLPEMDDDDYEDKVETHMKMLREAPAIATKVDFSSEALFTLTDLKAPDAKGDKRGHYGAEYLIASYLNRLASNMKDGSGDKKDDKGQIVALLQGLMAKGDEKQKVPEGKAEKSVFFEKVKEKVIGHINSQSNKKLPSILILLQQACDQLITGGASNAVHGSSVASSQTQASSWLTITEDTYLAIKALAEDRGLEDEADDLVAAFKAGGPYNAREGVEAALLTVVPQKQDAVTRIVDYIVEEYAE
jgi:hypothetical protein